MLVCLQQLARYPSPKNTPGQRAIGVGEQLSAVYLQPSDCIYRAERYHICAAEGKGWTTHTACTGTKMVKHIACVLWSLTAIAAAFAPPTRTNACGRASVVRLPPAPSTDGSRHVAIRASDDDEAEPFFAEPPPAPATNDDRIVAYVAVGSTLVFFGLYAYETLRLMAEGEFYMPHF